MSQAVGFDREVGDVAEAFERIGSGGERERPLETIGQGDEQRFLGPIVSGHAVTTALLAHTVQRYLPLSRQFPVISE